ncbi:hypothetical protein ACHAXR_003208, partial [Thalassiosira sp. AJA248-18]
MTGQSEAVSSNMTRSTTRCNTGVVILKEHTNIGELSGMVELSANMPSDEPNEGEEANDNMQSSARDHINATLAMSTQEAIPIKTQEINEEDFAAAIPTVHHSFSLSLAEVVASFPKTASISSTNSPSIDQEGQHPKESNFDIEAQSNQSLNNTALKELPCSECRRRVRLWYKQKIQPFWKIIIAQIICVIYIIVLTFATPPVGIKDPTSNNIIDLASDENTNNGVIYVNGSYRPVVAIGFWQKFCLAMSRMSAFSMYPMLVVVFFTKMKALQSFFVKTPLSMYFGVIGEGHDYHAHAGKYIAFDVWLHTVFHLLRWGSQGNIKLLWTSSAGLSGLITIIATPLITIPMICYKEKISYEIRKGLHYLFYVFAIAMCFHVPTTAIPNGGFIAPILGGCIGIYTLDACYVFLFMTEKIETTAFHVLSSGVRISMPVSERFQKQAGRGGFAYINLPWINDKQWHPFSLFEDPSDPSTQQMFLMKSGNWTNAVHKALSRDTTRPCWIQGPFPSPYSHASLYDNQILVASGIG